MANLEKNGIVRLEITAVSNEGLGIGRHEGMVVFVPVTVVGDIIDAKIVKVQKSHAYGIVEGIITSSPHRIENDCPVFPRCGGCSFRHMDYHEEIRVKTGFVRENLRRIGGVTLELEEGKPSPLVDRYRNKAQYPIGEKDGVAVLGFYAKRSHTVIPLEDCLLQPAIYSTICKIFTDFLGEYKIAVYAEETGKGLVRHLAVRSNSDNSQILVTVVINGQRLPHSDKLLEALKNQVGALSGLVLSHNTRKNNTIMGSSYTELYGDGTIVDSILGVKLTMAAGSFYQVNRGAMEELYRKVIEYVDPQKEDVLLDLYCGIGSIGLMMAQEVALLVGVESYDGAVENARQNAAENGIDNALFIAAAAEEVGEKLREEAIVPTVVVIDPPRKGLEVETIKTIADWSPNRIVYVSCNSATLARDIKEFGAVGYEVEKGAVVDMFPRTVHIESVILLRRCSQKT